MHRVLRLVMLAAFATAAADGRELHAQTPAQGSAAANPELAAALQVLRPGHLVRFSVGGVRDTGRVALGSSSQLSLRRRPNRDAMPASSIDSLWTWTSNKGTGARTGAIVVGAFGAYIGNAIAGLRENRPKTLPTLGFGIGGALVGAAFGAMIGDQFSHWTLVHPRNAGLRRR